MHAFRQSTGSLGDRSNHFVRAFGFNRVKVTGHVGFRVSDLVFQAEVIAKYFLALFSESFRFVIKLQCLSVRIAAFFTESSLGMEGTVSFVASAVAIVGEIVSHNRAGCWIDKVSLI